jgi:hypothetical protein
VQELEPDDPAHDERQAEQAEGAHRLGERDHAVGRRPHGADADPDGVAGADGDLPEGVGRPLMLATMPRAQISTGTGREKPFDSASAAAQTVSNKPETTSATHAMTGKAIQLRLASCFSFDSWAILA